MKVGIYGMGLMGSQIAQVLATYGHEVVGYVRSETSATKSMNEVTIGNFGLHKLVEKDKFTVQEVHEILGRIQYTFDIRDLRDCEVVIESIAEDLAVKICAMTLLDDVCDGKTIIVSNTSGYSITILALATKRPAQVVGMHWFNPPQIMKLVEVIVPHYITHYNTLKTISDLATSCNKTVVEVKDSTMKYGHVANRAYIALIKECREMVKEGIATEEQIDLIMKLGYGFPLGPFEVLKFVGKMGRKEGLV